jgi:hypothetical protein
LAEQASPSLSCATGSATSSRAPQSLSPPPAPSPARFPRPPQSQKCSAQGAVPHTNRDVFPTIIMPYHTAAQPTFPSARFLVIAFLLLIAHGISCSLLEIKSRRRNLRQPSFSPYPLTSFHPYLTPLSPLVDYASLPLTHK